MAWGERGTASVAFVLVLLASLALAAIPAANPPGVTAPPPQGIPEVDVDKNCYLPGENVTIVLRNVGTGTLILGYQPNYVVWNETAGYVREALDGYPHIGTRIAPGANLSWTWDGYWLTADNSHKGNLAPPGDYFAIVRVLAGFPQPELQDLGQAPFSIGGCLAQITAGADFSVPEGQPFEFHPTIRITGNATITSVTWDLNPSVDTNGDGNTTDDVDLVGPNPTTSFGDDGVYPVVMNVRGFGQIQSKTRLDQDVVFVISSSDSMTTSDPYGARKDMTKLYVDRLAPHDRAAVVSFNDSARLVGNHILSEDYAQVKADIGTIGSSGGSYLAGGLRLGLRELEAHGNPDSAWLAVFLTDGESTSGIDRFELPRVIQLAKDLGVPVYVVGLRVAPWNEPRLMDIANETGGAYFPEANLQNMMAIFNTVGQKNDTESRYFVVSDDLVVTVNNVSPTVDLAADVAQAPPVNLTLRVAGEKFHDVRLGLLVDGAEVANATVLRMPGNPDDQTATIRRALLPDNANVARLVYTPLDDAASGQVNGANPAWLNVTLANGTVMTYHHTFNVQDNASWVWDVDLSAAAAGNMAHAVLTAKIGDPGSDDEFLTIDWGDGTVDARTYYYDGAGPDPYPSPWGGPVSLNETFLHGYARAGTYAVTVTATDDDGGVTVAIVAIDVT